MGSENMLAAFLPTDPRELLASSDTPLLVMTTGLALLLRFVAEGE